MALRARYTQAWPPQTPQLSIEIGDMPSPQDSFSAPFNLLLIIKKAVNRLLSQIQPWYHMRDNQDA
jgi:hypothetical protein